MTENRFDRRFRGGFLSPENADFVKKTRHMSRGLS
jgi:hypothetical protein